MSTYKFGVAKDILDPEATFVVDAIDVSELFDEGCFFAIAQDGGGNKFDVV